MDEDAHLCLRCRATIVGLDHYVAHRQAGCARNAAHEAKLQSEGSETDEEVKTYAKKDQQEARETKSLSDIPYPSDTHPLTHGSDRATTQERSDSEDIVSTTKYPSSESSIRDCYIHQSGQTPVDQSRTAADASSLHEPYTVMEDFTAALPQPPSEAPMASSHVELKHKTQESLSLSHRPSSSQAPFTGYKDPLLLHGHDAPILRHFDSFSDHSKIPHEGESESHSETMALFKVSSSSYELESQNFESRYSDFYSIQPTPQEPLLTNVTTLDQSKAKERIQSNIKLSDNTESQSVKDKEVTPEETYEKGVREAREEFPDSSLKFSESGTSDNVHEKPELRQDDFLSSLELRSSVKVPTKRRHEEEDEFDEDEDDETRPPHHHTGGKWRPGSRPPPSVGGKWRPSTPKTELEEEEEEEMEEDYVEEEEESLMPPPPTYTKGKWLPGKKMTNIIKVGSTVEYHCQACSRVLKGKEAYERHLKSQLHFVNENKASGKRKTKASKVIPPITKTTRPARSKKLEAQNFLKSTIAHLKSRKIVSQDARNIRDITRPITWKGVTGSFPSNKLTKAITEEEEQQVDEEEVVHKFSSSTPKMLCPICKLSFGEAYAALHFASLAHIHNELEERQTKNKGDPKFNKLILQNITSIVKTSPFFCESCKFYCNLHEDFVAHMNTHTNDPENDEVKTMFSCSACSDEEEMQLPNLIHHLQTPHHTDNARDLVLQAQQVMLTSRTLVVCPMGDGTFRYRRQYQIHRRIKHQEPGFQVTNRRMLRCPKCDFKTLRKQQIRAHIKKTHETSQDSKDYYHCFICGLSFTTQQKAEVHRRSAEHRTTLWRQRGCSVTRTCSLCYEEVDDLPALRQHMSQAHQKDCTPCHLCGIIPPLRSDLAKHQRVCKGVPGDMEGQHKCDLCSFKNYLLAHVLAHKTVAHSQRQADGRYACHICKTKLQPSSVKGHMLSHSNEWPYPCHICSRKFSQKDWLEKHLSAVHTCGAHVHSAHSPALCDTCGKTFSNRWHLYRHQLEAHAHASPSVLSKKDPKTPDSPRPATKDDCRPPSQRVLKSKEPSSRPYLCDVCGAQCQTLTSLKTHRQCHKRGEGDKYECPHCNYATGHLPHLRRHLRLHTGATPYSCPYCSYACNNQENLRKHMLKTKRHPGRYMYECRLCASSQDQLSKESGAESNQPLNPEPAAQQATDSSVVHPLEPASSSSKSRDPEGSVSRQLESESSSSQPREPQYPQTQNYENSKPHDVDGCHPAGPEESLSRSASVSPNLDSTDPKPQSPRIFCSNYASQFHIHLLEKHKDAFKTKEEEIAHIRSYYHAEQDTTVTNDPLPFLHKKRNSEPQTSRPSGTAPTSYSSRAAQAKRRQGLTAIKGEKDDPDDPASEGTEETNEDVLTQLRRSLHIDEFGCDNKVASDAQDKETEIRQTEEAEDGGNETLKRDGELHEEQNSPAANTSLTEADAPEDDAFKSTSSCPRRPPPSLRAPSRPAILRSSTAQGEAAQPLRIMIQQLRGDTTVEVDDDGTQQVIIILPDKLGEQPGDVAALLPSLGLASSDDCGSLSMVHQKDINQQPLTAKDAADDTVIMQTDQMIALDTQVVTDAAIVSGETNVVQPKRVLRSAQVFNPLQVVAEAAEVLTQNELVTRESHQILTGPHQVLAHSSTNQDVLAGAPPVRTTQILDAAMFGAAGVQHSEVTHATEEQTVLQPEATLSFVDEQVPSRDQTKPDDGEIIYSFTLQ